MTSLKRKALAVDTPSNVKALAVDTPSNVKALDVDTPSNVKALDVDTPSNVKALAVDTPSNVKALAVDTPSNVKALAVDTPSNVKALDVDTPSNVKALAVDTPSNVKALAVDTPSNVYVHTGTKEVPTRTRNARMVKLVSSSFLRFVVWRDNPCPSEKFVRGVCIFNVLSLPKLANSLYFFANKFYADYSRVALRCLAEELHNRTTEQALGTLDFNVTFYEQQAFCVSSPLGLGGDTLP
ncbi:hypothetical protein ACOMHN_021076 [Nucella lapillus]